MERNFLLRFVNLLINNCENGKEDLYQATTLVLKISQNQLQNLRRLQKSGEIDAIIRLLNGITSKMTTAYESRSSFMDFFQSEEVWSNIGVAAFALIPLCIFVLYGTMRNVVCILSLAVFAVGYFKTYKLMLKKVELQYQNTLSQNLACNAYNKSWFQWLFGSSNDEECLKQLHARNIDPTLEVTPVHVISHMLAVGSFQPIEHFGIMFSRLSKQILDSHSMLYGWLVFIIAVGVIMYIITLCFSGIFGRNLSIGNRHISLGITGSAHTNTKQICTSSEKSPNDDMLITKMQPVIQIFNNYPFNNTDKSAATNELAAKKSICNKSADSNIETETEEGKVKVHKNIEREEPHKIQDNVKGRDLDKMSKDVKVNEPSDNHKTRESDKCIASLEVLNGEDSHKIHVIVKENIPAEDTLQEKQTELCDSTSLKQ